MKEIDTVDFVVKNYTSDLSKVVILDRETEAEYFRQYKEEGNMEARDKLIESCLRFVVKIARKYANDQEQKKTLISAGNEGLLIALERYDPERGTRFLSYAAWYIILFIREELYKDATVPVPVWRRKSAKKLQKTRESFILSAGYEPSVEELAKASSLTERQVRNILGSNHIMLSVDSRDAADTLQKETDQDMLDDVLIDKQGKEVLNTVISCLPVREQFIVRAYYGLVFDEPLSLKQIASLVGLSSERVRQIKIEALKRIKSLLKARNVNSVDDII